MGSRARNALRRPVFIGTASILTFAASLVALVVVPQQARRAATAMRPVAAARPDTEPTVASLAEAQRQVARADSGLVAARNELAQLVAATAAAAAADTTAAGDTLTAALRSRRDSLTNDAALLGRLLTRAENAPLLPSYRALAEAAPMRGDARVKQLLDSLVEIERERESYNAVGGVDPVFVALTNRANDLGHSIEVLANARRADVQRQLAALSPASSPAATALETRPLPDTLARLRARDTAQTIAYAVAGRLARERAELVRLDSLEEKARQLANVGASPPAMLAAALIIGAMIGFGIAFLGEVRRPRVANAWEAERATGARVLGVIRPLPPSPERGRRASDREGPPYIDPGADGHQLIYLAIATAGANVVMVTVTGDSPAVSAVVAINFAAIAAQEARATLLVDTDPTDAVEAALRLPASPGVAGLIEEKLTWPEAVRATRIGRDRTIDVVPSGRGPLPLDRLGSLLKRDATRLSRYYDALVLMSSPEQVTQGLPGALPIPDVIYCARIGQTPIAELKRMVEAIDQAGGRLRGLVLWNAPDPALADVRPVEEGRRELAGV